MSEQKIQVEKISAKKEALTAEVELPPGVSASIKDSMLLVKFGKNEVSHKIETRKLGVTIHGNKVIVTGLRATQNDKRMVNSMEAHVKNLVKGVIEPYLYTLKVCSGHFPITVDVKGDKLTVKNFFGEKVPRVLMIKKGAKVVVEGEKITVESSNKETAGQVSADIEQLVRRPGFDTRIFQDGIYITSKHGKEIK